MISRFFTLKKLANNNNYLGVGMNGHVGDDAAWSNSEEVEVYGVEARRSRKITDELCNLSVGSDGGGYTRCVPIKM